jgi:excisionase family DNA binding protein
VQPFSDGGLAVRLEPWASVEQLTEHLGVTRDTIYRWIDNKSLPAHRIGRLWKFKLSEVDAWVRSGGLDESGASLSSQLRRTPLAPKPEIAAE